MCPESATLISVARKNRPSGSFTGGKRSASPYRKWHTRSAATAAPIRQFDAEMEHSTATTLAKVR